MRYVKDQVIREGFQRIELAFRALGMSQCSSCSVPMGRDCWKLFGCCHSCWMESEDLGDRVDFSQVSKLDLANAWQSLMFPKYLSGTSLMAKCEHEPSEWRLAWSLLCAFGEEQIKTALASHPRKLLFMDPSKLRFVPNLGLVPFAWREETEPRTSAQWRDYWDTERAAIAEATGK